MFRKATNLPPTKGSRLLKRSRSRIKLSRPAPAAQKTLTIEPRDRPICVLHLVGKPGRLQGRHIALRGLGVLVGRHGDPCTDSELGAQSHDLGGGGFGQGR